MNKSPNKKESTSRPLLKKALLTGTALFSLSACNTAINQTRAQIPEVMTPEVPYEDINDYIIPPKSQNESVQSKEVTESQVTFSPGESAHRLDMNGNVVRSATALRVASQQRTIFLGNGYKVDMSIDMTGFDDTLEDDQFSIIVAEDGHHGMDIIIAGVDNVKDFGVSLDARDPWTEQTGRIVFVQKSLPLDEELRELVSPYTHGYYLNFSSLSEIASQFKNKREVVVYHRSGSDISHTNEAFSFELEFSPVYKEK